MVLITFIVIFSVFAFSKWNTEAVDMECEESTEIFEKHKGVHLFGYLDTNNLTPFVKDNYDWITMVPWGFQKTYDSPGVSYTKGDSASTASRDSTFKSQIDIAHDAGMSVNFKPHVWIWEDPNEKWRSDIFPTNEENWKVWEKDYREFIMVHAQMAENNKVEMFTIGTELTRLAIEKEQFWRELIREVRKIYSGKITYAANWYEEFEKINFWDELDFIGIQAYFPLSNHNDPGVEDISKGWENYLATMEAVSKKYDRKIIFTEMGYKSTSDSATRPWEWVENSSHADNHYSEQTQANCYEAFFNCIWGKEWFAGVHIWQMRTDYGEDRLPNKFDYTPQGKLAEKVIAKGFEQKL